MMHTDDVVIDFDNCHQDFNVAADDYVTFVTYGYGIATLF